ncbi:MAG TPA: hypothetical protein VGC94_08400 [Amnibacterium sp.]|jgi:hypothetical protein
MAAPAPSAVTAGSPTPVDATCLRCRREGLYHVELFRMHEDGPRRVGETTFCACETRPVPRPTITTGEPRHTGVRCGRCAGDQVYEVPFYAVTAAGIAPHTTRTVCRDCDTRPVAG